MSNTVTLTQLLKRTFTEMMKDLGTSIPGHILGFNPDTQLAQLQIGIVRVDVNGKSFTPSPLIECPVYVYGGDYMVETQIDPGTEGVIMFSQRCIDAWNDTGGVANNPILRFHDFSDAYFLPGIRSQKNKISGHANNGVRLRNKDGDKFIWLKNDGTAVIQVDKLTLNGDSEHNGDAVHNGNSTQTGDTAQTGDSNVSGTLTAATDVKAGPLGVSSIAHVHGGVTSGGSNTSTPT